MIRFAIAFVFASIVSMPIEMTFFEKEIQKEVLTSYQSERDTLFLDWQEQIDALQVKYFITPQAQFDSIFFTRKTRLDSLQNYSFTLGKVVQKNAYIRVRDTILQVLKDEEDPNFTQLRNVIDYEERMLEDLRKSFFERRSRDSISYLREKSIIDERYEGRLKNGLDENDSFISKRDKLRSIYERNSWYATFGFTIKMIIFFIEILPAFFKSFLFAGGNKRE